MLGQGLGVSGCAAVDACGAVSCTRMIVSHETFLARVSVGNTMQRIFRCLNNI